ncbi:hypothetical protein ACFX15_031713 [Malus domestica]
MKGLRETGFVGTLRFRGMLGTGGFRRLWICFGGCDDAAMVVSNISACTALKNFGPWIDEARKVLDGSPTKDVVLWKPMINGYVQYNHFNEAVALFKEMQTKRVKGDKLTAVALLIGCTQLGALRQGEWIHGCIEENRIKIDMEMYAKCGSIDGSLEIFNGLGEKDAASWT